MVQLTRESSQGDGGEYPAPHPMPLQQQQQPRPLLPQENTHPHPTPATASLEHHHQPRPPTTHHPSSTTATQGQLPAATNAPPPPQTHPPPPPMNLKYPDHPPGRDNNPPSTWDGPTMNQQGTNPYYPPPPNAAYTPKDEPRDDYNHGKTTTRPTTRDAHNFPNENYSSSNRNYGTYPGDKENYHRGANSSRNRGDKEKSVYNDREKSVYSDREKSVYRDREKYNYNDREKSIYNDRDKSVYSEREKSVYNDRDKSVYSERDSNYARHRGKHRDGRERSGDRYREMERDEDIKPNLSRHFEPIRSNDNAGQRRGRTESVTSVFSVASSRAPPIGGGSSRRGYDYYNEQQYGTGQQQNMYDQYKYYYQYYKDHPYYKEYYKQWIQQYEGYMEDRPSLHSGRSSVNDDTKKSATSQFVQDFHSRSSYGYEPSAIYAEASSLLNLKSYPSGDMSAVGSIPDESVNEARMTPLLFGRAHIKACFTPSGQLLVVLPKDPRDGEKANVQIRNIQKTLVSNPEMGKIVKKMQEFPGPLTIAETHKEVVVKYCERRIAEASADCQLSDKSSVILMWEYLALLVRQNGRLYGTDIARLLLKGQTESSASKEDHKNNDNVATPNAINNEHPANFINSPDSGLSLVNTTDFDLGSTNATEVPTVPIKNEAELIKKFTEYLCLGRKREALDYAMQEGLWGHCLALSARMDSNTHTRVLTSFLNDIPRHNVLQTLFQQLTGKKPEITKTYSEERWGDWQSHLAMMISNPTGNTEKDASSVLSLGDTLAKRGQLHAAHFCYLLATAEWGTFSDKDSKIVLIGADHQLSFQEFASNESIQCTEIYEYGRSLADTSSSLPSFQSYKLIYALRLAEAGLPQEALKYCEIINNVLKKSETFQVDFLSQVYNLASCLKYNDVHYQMCQGELSEMPDPDWLLNLKQHLDTAVSKQYSTESLTQAGYGGNNLSSGEYVDQAAADTTHHQGVDPYQHQVSTASDTTAAAAAALVVSQSYTYPSGNYDSGNYEAHDQSGYSNNNTTDVNTVNTENSYNTTPDQQQVPLVNPPPPQQQENEMPPNSVHMIPSTNSYHPVNNSSAMMTQQTDFAGGSGEEYNQNEPHQHPQPNQQWPMQPGSIEGTDIQESPADSAPIFMAPPPRASAAPALWQPGPTVGFMPPAPNHQPGSPVPQPQMPPMPSQPDEDTDYLSNSSIKSKASSDDTQSEPKKEETKKAGGLLSYIFGGGKKSNQAKLPDDKDPAIKWDEKTQKWISPDGSTDVAAPPPPPPKMGGPGGPPGALGFTRRSLKDSRYINTEKSSVSSPMRGGGPPPMPGGNNFRNMAPITPMMPLSEGGVNPQAQAPQQTPMMMPTSVAPIAPQSSSQDMDMPTPAADNAYSHEPDNQQQGAAVGGNEGGGIPMMMAPPSGGVAFFNPAQMTPGAATSTGGPSSSSQQRRLGPNRRVYPTK